MQPIVTAVGIVSRDGVYKKINEKGGFVSFAIRCQADNPRAGDPAPYQYYNVEIWVKDDNSLITRLTKGKPICVSGTWDVHRYNGKEYHTLRARDVQIIVLEG